MRSLRALTTLFVVLILVPGSILAWLGWRSTVSFEERARVVAHRQSQQVLDDVLDGARASRTRVHADLEASARAAAELLHRRLPSVAPGLALAEARRLVPSPAALAVRGADGSVLVPRPPTAASPLRRLREWPEFAARGAEADRQEFVAGDPAAAGRSWRTLGEELATHRLAALCLAHAAVAFRRAEDETAALATLARVRQMPMSDALAAGPLVVEAMLGDEPGLEWVRTAFARGLIETVPATATRRASWRSRCGAAVDPAEAVERACEEEDACFVVAAPLAATGATLELTLPRAALWPRLFPSEKDGCTVRWHEGEPTGNDPEVLSARFDAFGSRASISVHNPTFAGISGHAAQRRTMTTLGVLGLLAVMAAGLYLVRRALAREQAARRLRDEFIANVSHELKTPLTSIRLHADMLAEDGVSAETRQRYGEVVEAEGTRLSSLVEDLLDFAALERGQRHLEPAPLNIAAAVRAAARSWQPLAAREGIDLRVEADGEVLAMADATALSRIFANLMQNAWRHGRPPRIDGERPRIVLRALPGPAVEVGDNGPGVPEGERALVFERFGRGTRAANKGGAGIGLSLSRELARAMGGDLRIDDDGHETLFRLTLPPAPETAHTQHSDVTDPER